MDHQEQKEYRENKIEIRREKNPSHHDYMNPYVSTAVKPSSSSRFLKEYCTRVGKEYKSSSSSSSSKNFGKGGFFYGFPKPESIRRVSRSYIRPEDECPLLAASTPKLKKGKKKNMKLSKNLDDEDGATVAEGKGGGSSTFYRECSERNSFKYASTFPSNPPNVLFNDVYSDPLDLEIQPPARPQKFKKDDTRGAISIEKRKNRNRGSRREGGCFEDEAKIRNYDIFEPRDAYEDPETFINPSSSEKQPSRARARSRVRVPRETVVQSHLLPPKLPPKKMQRSSSLLALPPSPPPPIQPHLISTLRRREIRENGGGARQKNYKKQSPTTGDNNNFDSTTFRASSMSRKKKNKTRQDDDDPRRRKEKNVFKNLSDAVRMKLKVKEGWE